MATRFQSDSNKGIRPPEVSTDKIKDLLQASYGRNTPAREIGNKYGMTLDDSLSNSEHKVYTDNKGNPTVAFTGTRTVGNWGTNLLLATGLHGFSTRFRDAKKLMDDVHKKYNKPAVISGHSLGGALAEYAGGKNDKIVTVNKGVGIGTIGKKVGKNQVDIRSGSDLVSALANTQNRTGKAIVIKNTNYLNPFTSHKYQLLSKLNNKIL